MSCYWSELAAAVWNFNVLSATLVNPMPFKKLSRASELILLICLRKDPVVTTFLHFYSLGILTI